MLTSLRRLPRLTKLEDVTSSKINFRPTGCLISSIRLFKARHRRLPSNELYIQSVQTAKEFLDAMADNLEENLFPGDPPRKVSSENLGSITVQHTTLESAVATSDKEGASTFYAGSSLTDRFMGPRECGQGQTCTGVILSIIQQEINLITEDESQRDHDVEVDDTQVWCFRNSQNKREKKRRVTCTCPISLRARFPWNV